MLRPIPVKERIQDLTEMKAWLGALPILALSFSANATGYGPYLDETYDTCGPSDAKTSLILIHGGAWIGGTAENIQVTSLCKYLGLRNIYVVAVNYRLAGATAWPAQLQDAQFALRWLRQGPAKRVGVIGLSAGGQVALSMAFAPGTTMYARTDPKTESALLPDKSDRPDFVVDISGPTDLTEEGLLPAGVRYLTRGTGMSRTAAQAFASPIVHITTEIPPLLVIHGISDPLVPVSQSDDLIAALTDAGVGVTRTDSGAANAASVSAPVVYDRHPGKHVFADLANGRVPLFQEILRFVKGT
jgi:acetyl esterase/lipase